MKINIDGIIINSKGKELSVFRDLYLIPDDTIKSGSLYYNKNRNVVWAYYLYTLQLLEFGIWYFYLFATQLHYLKMPKEKKNVGRDGEEA